MHFATVDALSWKGMAALIVLPQQLIISHKWNCCHQREHHFGQCRNKQQLPAGAQSFCSLIHFLWKVILNVARRFCLFKDKCGVLSWGFTEATGGDLSLAWSWVALCTAPEPTRLTILGLLLGKTETSFVSSWAA